MYYNYNNDKQKINKSLQAYIVQVWDRMIIKCSVKELKKNKRIH